MAALVAKANGVNPEEAQWLAVIAKSLAVLAMHRSELGTSEIMIKAEFLEGLSEKAPAPGLEP